MRGLTPTASGTGVANREGHYWRNAANPSRI